jgi:hypothetical protein
LISALAWADVLLTSTAEIFAELLGRSFYDWAVLKPGDFLQRERAAGRLGVNVPEQEGRQLSRLAPVARGSVRGFLQPRDDDVARDEATLSGLGPLPLDILILGAFDVENRGAQAGIAGCWGHAETPALATL